MKQEEIERFALVEPDHQRLRRVGIWQEQIIYAPEATEGIVRYKKAPPFVMVKGEEIRWSTDEETKEIADYFLHLHPYEEE